MTRSSVTIRDVAALAGVSHQTVSRVINGVERVSPETRQRVQKAIEALGYTPNAIARFMSRGRTHILACFSPNLTDYTFASLIEGAESEARQQGYFVITSSASDASAFKLLVDQLINTRQVEGLIVINPYADERYQALPSNVPTVFLGARPREGCVDAVYLDEETAGYMATQHLVQLGHRCIVHLTGPRSEDCAQDRYSGYVSALYANGLHPEPGWILEGDWSATSGFQAIQTWQSQKTPFTAIFAQNDRMAVGAIRALHEAGLEVPGDVSVVGFDDMPLASYFDPALTTMRQDICYSGSQAARLLVQRIAMPDTPCQVVHVPADLVIRGSTAPIERR